MMRRTTSSTTIPSIVAPYTFHSRSSGSSSSSRSAFPSNNNNQYHRKQFRSASTLSMSLFSSSSTSFLSLISSSTTKLSSSSSTTTNQPIVIAQVGENIGSGSYGTVHKLLCMVGEEDEQMNKNRIYKKEYIGKRAWTKEELKVTKDQVVQNPTKKANRCEYYQQVEQHCFEKLGDHSQLPNYQGTVQDQQGRSWMLFDILYDDNHHHHHHHDDISTSSTVSILENEEEERDDDDDDDDNSESKSKTTKKNHIKNKMAPSLADIMKMDYEYQINNNNNNDDSNDDDDDDSKQTSQSQLQPRRRRRHHHHLYHLQKALLGLEEEDDDEETRTKKMEVNGEDTDDVDVDYDVSDDDSLSSAALSSLGETLDIVMESLLKIVSYIHSKQIVHRDVKPANILIANQSLYLIDFGSAADMEPLVDQQREKTASTTTGGEQEKEPQRRRRPLSKLLPMLKQERMGMKDGNLVAVSPIYAAPELFIDVKGKPLVFDVFSVALIYCQLLFNYLEERTDAGFHQQLASCDWDLELWLDQEIMSSKVRPKGMEIALQILSDRPGLFRLLCDMLQQYTFQRIDSNVAHERFRNILVGKNDTMTTMIPSDGLFFQTVIETSEICPIVIDDDVEELSLSSSVVGDDNGGVFRPLHFVATFRRNQPLGLVLSEPDATDDNHDHPEDEDDDNNIMMKNNPEEFFQQQQRQQQWIEATKDARPGQVFVKEIIQDGQADQLGIFEIGDQLQGVGELPLGEGGFSRAVQLLNEDQPKSMNKRKYITLHFDRKKMVYGGSSRSATSTMTTQSQPLQSQQLQQQSKPLYPIDHGIWSIQGKRQYQEDNFILHEFPDPTTTTTTTTTTTSTVLGGRSVLLAGVFDGHGGDAASKMVSEQLPDVFSQYVFGSSSNPRRRRLRDVSLGLEKAWETICETYRNQCNDPENCIVGYDAREGRLMGHTGSSQVVAGTTTSMVALDESNGRLAILNCGDSRSLVIDSTSSSSSYVTSSASSSATATATATATAASSASTTTTTTTTGGGTTKTLMGTVLFQTSDHSPQYEMERFRRGIEEEGLDYSMPQCSLSRWFVSVGRYQYALSRSLEGPFATSKGIISDPDITTLQGTEGMTIVIATDGLFEVMDSEEVAHYITSMRNAQKTITAGDAAKRLCSMAYKKGSADNISVIVVYL